MDKLEKYSWKSGDFSTKFQSVSSMSVDKTSDGSQLKTLNRHIQTDMDKPEKYSWKSGDPSTKFQSASPMSADKMSVGCQLKIPN